MKDLGSKERSKEDLYDHRKIEEKWKKQWNESKLYEPDIDKAKNPFYNLMMFPYPSAEGLHVGSVFTFTGVDTYGRFKRMQGYDVFEPMGLDGFGIHSENYALKVGRHPVEQAKLSEKNFYRQLSSIGNGFDWSRKLETYDPNYYKWTQWIFIQLFKMGLAYRKKAPVNFCPKDLTVLSDEQVIDGKCERCSSVVEKRELEQWFFKITDYAERLLNNIPSLNWTEKVKIAQRDWIGRSEGVRLEFKIQNSKFKIDVFTTAVDTVFGTTFMVISPENPILKHLNISKEYRIKIDEYVKKAKDKSEIDRTREDKEKTGVPTGIFVINPLDNKEIPLWVADYVLMGYGTGAVMGVPGHDARDYEFAKKFGLEIIPVIRPTNNDISVSKDGFWEYADIKKHRNESELFDSKEFSGMDSATGKSKIIEFIEKEGFGKKEVNYHLRDWLISRQRYWGPPIPMIYCEKCQWQPVPEDQLPVLLPDVEDWKPKGNGSSPLSNMKDFVGTVCPKCGGEARRETDVSDTFLDSSWYFFRYISTDIQDKAFSLERAKKWLPVTMYIGGAEHSVLHLLYSRFITMVFKDLDLISFEEPYKRFYAHGLIIKDGAKMSKSKGNVINPDEYLEKYGADTVRAYLRFVGPFDMGGDFRDSGIEGMHKFLRKVWKFVANNSFKEERRVDIYLNRLIKEITEETEALRFNTAFARVMMYYNFLAKKQPQNIAKEEILTFIKLLAPFVPFMAEELWEKLGQEYSVHKSSWPTYDKKLLTSDIITMVIQINGKTRATFIADVKLKKEEAEEKARTIENIKKHLENRKIVKVIFVPGKILNFVIA